MFDGLSAEVLARFQFAFTISFHIIFPAFSIGLASYLAVLNALWLRTRNETYKQLFEYWKKIFAVAFAMGVVSGIVCLTSLAPTGRFSRIKRGRLSGR